MTHSANLSPTCSSASVSTPHLLTERERALHLRVLLVEDAACFDQCATQEQCSTVCEPACSRLHALTDLSVPSAQLCVRARVLGFELATCDERQGWDQDELKGMTAGNRPHRTLSLRTPTPRRSPSLLRVQRSRLSCQAHVGLSIGACWCRPTSLLLPDVHRPGPALDLSHTDPSVQGFKFALDSAQRSRPPAQAPAGRYWPPALSASALPAYQHDMSHAPPLLHLSAVACGHARVARLPRVSLFSGCVLQAASSSCNSLVQWPQSDPLCSQSQ